MKPIHIVILIIVVLLPLHIRSQVTIGSGTEPGNRALLDIKEADENGADVIAKGGLAMPRVALTSRDNLYPMFSAGDTDDTYKIGASIYNKAEQDKAHAGLWVYNVTECANPFPRDKGLYLWNDNNQWEYMGKEEGPQRRLEYKLEDGKYIYKGMAKEIEIPYEKLPIEKRTLLDERDQNVYFTRKFGDAGEWMLQNLRYDPTIPGNDEEGLYTGYTQGYEYFDPSWQKRFAYSDNANAEYQSNGTYSLPDLVERYGDGSGPPTYRYGPYPNDNWLKNYKELGIFYTWWAAMNGDEALKESIMNGETRLQSQGEVNQLDVGPRGICPPGWHLPSDKEWNDLEREIYQNAHLYSHYTQSEVLAANIAVPWENSWDIATNAIRRPVNSPTYGHLLAMMRKCPSDINLCTKKSYEAERGGFDILGTGYLSLYINVPEGTNNNSDIIRVGGAAKFCVSSVYQYIPVTFKTSVDVRSTSPCVARLPNYEYVIEKSKQHTDVTYMSVRCKRD